MGTYGSFTQPFTGFSASQDCSVGYWTDHDAEAKAFRRKQDAAKGALLARRDLFQRIYDRFASGEHAYRRHCVHLDRERTAERDDDYKIRFDLPGLKARGGPEMDGGGRISIHLYLKRGLAPIHRELALAGFLLSQAGHFRDCFRIEPMAPAFESVFNGWGWTETCLSFPRALMMAFANEEALRGSPTVEAALLRAVIDAAPIPSEIIARVGAGLLIRFAPDSQWPEIRRRVQGVLNDLERRDSVVREWWSPIVNA